jgi:hypothetical protein
LCTFFSSKFPPWSSFSINLFYFKWTPDGRRLITGASSGEFTLWNGLTFNFETILQVILDVHEGEKNIIILYLKGA